MRALGVFAAAVLVPFADTGAQNYPRTSRIVGVVADSVDGAPLGGAEVIVSGLAQSVKTDSLGRFEIDSLPPGTYQVGVFHPLLTSLDITLATQPFVIGPDSAGVVTLAVPSVPTLLRRYCGNELPQAIPSAVAGRVLDPDSEAPISGASVTLTWTDVTVSKETGVVNTPHERHAETSGSGFFKICGLPSDLDGTIQAARRDVKTPEIPMSLNGSLLGFRNLLIAGQGARTSGIVTGRVLSPNGRPVAGARVEIPGSGASSQTGDDGSFRLTGAPTGTQMLVARSLSFAPAAEPINVTSHEQLGVTITLAERVSVLESVVVTAREDYALERSGFSGRSRLGTGYFVRRADIDRRRPHVISDMLSSLPSVTVSRERGGAVVRGRGGATSFHFADSCNRLYVDGFEWRDLAVGDLDDIVNPDDVIGMEVYQAGQVPARFQSFRNCLVIVVWTQFRGKAKN